MEYQEMFFLDNTTINPLNLKQRNGLKQIMMHVEHIIANSQIEFKSQC